MEHKTNSCAPVNVAYAAQGRNKSRDMCSVQCYSCKGFGHIAKDCSQKFCNYCKQQGHIITAYPIRHERKQGVAYHASIGASSSTTLPVSTSVPTPPANTLTPEMVQQMILSAFSTFGLLGSSVREDNPEGT
ncbi:uncharacterized protein LOC109798946 isoform X4 [Cajanus cajan]|nr:uncharacterized protein LOC109798946 isoform X4 [Cajanus cajan]XP_029127135.1 uncharacterized protein LOC109798946 isoform X4 [Cajanus cajan]